MAARWLRRAARRLVRRPRGAGRRDAVPRERHARPERPARAARARSPHHYELFGGVSPINAPEPRADRRARGRARRARRSTCPIYLGNRNWHPFLADTMREMRDAGVRRRWRSSPPPSAPTRAAASTARTSPARRRRSGAEAPEVCKLRAFYNHPGFVEANADRVRDALAQIPEERRRRARSSSRRTASRSAMAAQLPLRGAAHRDGAPRRRRPSAPAALRRLPEPQRPAAGAVARARRLRPASATLAAAGVARRRRLAGRLRLRPHGGALRPRRRGGRDGRGARPDDGRAPAPRARTRRSSR